MAGDIQSTLLDALREFDGRALSLLGEAEARLGGDPAYLDALIECARSDEGFVASGATWLIKNALENGRSLSPEQIQAYARAIPGLGEWSAQLHACQSVQFMTIAEEESAALVGWLRPLLAHDRPFLRAWSLDALGHLAGQHENFEAEFLAALKTAEDDAAASVRARARQIRQRLRKSRPRPAPGRSAS